MVDDSLFDIRSRFGKSTITAKLTYQVDPELAEKLEFDSEKGEVGKKIENELALSSDIDSSDVVINRIGIDAVEVLVKTNMSRFASSDEDVLLRTVDGVMVEKSMKDDISTEKPSRPAKGEGEEYVFIAE